MIRKLIFLLIFFAPFTTWLAISGWLRLPVVILLLLISVSVPYLIYNFAKKPGAIFQDKEDLILVFFLLIVWTSFFFGFFNKRSFNHSLSYTFSVVCYFLLIKLLIRQKDLSIDNLCKVVAYSVYFNNLIIIVEWLMINFFHFGIRSYFKTGGEITSNMDYYPRGFFISVAGAGEEPGGTASLLNIYFPIGLWYLKKYNKKVFWYTACHALGALFLTSVAGILIIAGSYAFINYKKLTTVLKYWYLITIVVVVLSISYSFNIFSSQRFIEKYYEYMEAKATLSNSNYSALDRKLKSQYAIEDWQKSPFLGNGPGYGVEKHSSGYFNTFLTLLADTGFIGFSTFTIYLLFIFFKLLHLDSIDRKYMSFAFICLFFHSLIYYVYYHEPFWLPIILIQLFYEHSRKHENSSMAMEA